MTTTIDTAKEATGPMTIREMLAIARNSGEPLDPFWGETPSVMGVLAAYYGGFNVGSTAAFDAIRK